MGSVTLWNLLFVVEVLLAAAAIALVVWAYLWFTRRYRPERKQPHTDRS